MASSSRKILICSCEGTMPLDEQAVRVACPSTTVTTHRNLCRSEIDRFRTAAQAETRVTVACTQESALFDEVAGETGSTATIDYVNIRETAGWSRDCDRAGPKMAALLAAATETMPSVPMVSVESEGVILIYGGERAVEAGHLLKDQLDVTVLLRPDVEIAPPLNTEFPLARGVIRQATGHIGGFELMVDSFSQPSPSSRASLVFDPPRDGARSRCDVILDLSGGPALFSAADLRDGYLRANPGDRVAVLQAVLKARDFVGIFDKPRYIDFDDALCAHARSRIVGCDRCLDLCPAGAISPAGDHVIVDAHVCAGCGQCAAVCPTGAAAYALPPADALMRKLRTMLSAYLAAGGERAVVLFHDEPHGTPLISMLARHGDGLPSNVLPVGVNEVTQVGLETVAAAFAYGAAAVRFLLRAKPRHDVTGLRRTVALADPILRGLGFGSGRVTTIETDDPDELGSILRGTDGMDGVATPATFLPVGGKRSVLRFALSELHAVAPEPADVIELPARAPFGGVEIDAAGCTLCLACVSACPTGALSDDPERPVLRFDEHACVQCGLCKATCPEKVITLKPRLDFRAHTAPARVLKEEEPYCCIRCGKAFGVRSTIERVAAKLDGKHWMYAGFPSRADVIRMCDDCRVAVVTEQDFDPYGAPPRPPVRTTEDYLRERDEAARQKIKDES